jgi:hypothetical protein
MVTRTRGPCRLIRHRSRQHRRGATGTPTGRRSTTGGGTNSRQRNHIFSPPSPQQSLWPERAASSQRRGHLRCASLQLRDSHVRFCCGRCTSAPQCPTETKVRTCRVLRARARCPRCGERLSVWPPHESCLLRRTPHPSRHAHLPQGARLPRRDAACSRSRAAPDQPVPRIVGIEKAGPRLEPSRVDEQPVP